MVRKNENDTTNYQIDKIFLERQGGGNKNKQREKNYGKSKHKKMGRWKSELIEKKKKREKSPISKTVLGERKVKWNVFEKVETKISQFLSWE